MIYVLAVITAAYALLSALAATVQMKSADRKDAPILMLTGGILMLAAAVTVIILWQFDWVLAVTGSALICIAALINGRRGEFHASHHIVRLALTVILTIGFVLL